jgi:hypothetical protein
MSKWCKTHKSRVSREDELCDYVIRNQHGWYDKLGRLNMHYRSTRECEIASTFRKQGRKGSEK